MFKYFFGFFLFLQATITHALIVNGDFEDGLTGWNTFTTVNGTSAGGFNTAVYDTDNDGVASSAFSVRPGQISYQSDSHAGVGITQSFNFTGGTLNISADIASITGTNNVSGSLVQMILDGLVLDSFDFSDIDVGVPEYHFLTSIDNVAAGSHDLTFLFTRPFLTSSVTNYLDDVVVSATSVPVPGTLALFILGLMGFNLSRIFKSKK